MNDTEDPNSFGFYSPVLEEFSGVGHSIEDCLDKGEWGMQGHLLVLEDEGAPPTVTIHNEEATGGDVLSRLARR